MTSPAHEAPEETPGSTSAEHASRFRFKSKKRRRERRRSRDRSASPRSDLHERRRHHHRRSGRRRHSPIPEESPEDGRAQSGLDPDVAFRESLFDAMADDEGAQYWEGVYGQPIHTYSDMKAGPEGELERMTDDEYAAFVRAKMYEKTHQHLIEEKARREAARKEREQRAKEGAEAEHESRKFRRKVEESLRRGEERKSRRAWEERWDGYLEKWQSLGSNEQPSTAIHVASIPWPVESGKRKDVSQKEVERFFVYAPSSGQPTETQLQKTLKVERVRWHPDKIQQKLGGQDVGEEVIQAVTEVFQIIDDLWTTVRRNGA